MALIKSISGIRGTIGGVAGKGLTPIDIVKFTSAYGAWVRQSGREGKIVVGRDGRMSGAMVRDLVCATLSGMGFDVTDLGLSTTPTVEMAVKMSGAAGGIILTASHNPRQWNALKLLNAEGEFLDAADGKWLLEQAEGGEIAYAEVDALGKVESENDWIEKHIHAILEHPLVDAAAVAKMNYKVVVDAVNSTGAIAVPQLLTAMGVMDVVTINGEVTGDFAHNPEPLPEHLTGLCDAVVRENATVGIAVDPDVDRLCFVCENGDLFGEEYTLVAIADYVLSHKKGNTVSNMSSTRALRDITEKHGGQYEPSAVGEVNVVARMKAINAVIGGEGNGGVIVPELHYGRDALAGIALFLTQLAGAGRSVSELRAQYPNYFMSKNKIELAEGASVTELFETLKARYHNMRLNTADGLRIDFDNKWVHFRTSNTEPIIRVYAEATSTEEANELAQKFVTEIKDLMG